MYMHVIEIQKKKSEISMRYGSYRKCIVLLGLVDLQRACYSIDESSRNHVLAHDKMKTLFGDNAPIENQEVPVVGHGDSTSKWIAGACGRVIWAIISNGQTEALVRVSSLGPQGLHRLDGRCAARGQPSCRGHCEYQNT